MKSMRDLVSLCKRRGFVFPTSEIYGGFSNSYDFGPLGTQLKKNLLDSWWRRFVTSQRNCHGIDSACLLPPKVWEQSGHLSNFTDPLVDCKSCGKRFRADHLVDDYQQDTCADSLAANKCPCGNLQIWGDDVSSVREFNLMFGTSVGPIEGQGSLAYLRPETAQGAYINFNNVATSAREKLPFGIAQTGKAFRNEVTPGNFIFRTREFEQMELQWFCTQEESPEWFEHWLNLAQDWLVNEVGIKPESVRLLEHEKDKLAHYAVRTVDIEFKFPFGWGELWGIANRGVYDLTCHGITYSNSASKEKCVPAVIEPALGLSRLVLAALSDAYEVEELPNNDKRTVLHLHHNIAPITWAVLPLIPKDEDQIRIATEIHSSLAMAPYGCVDIDISRTGIGKRYRRQDEVGTPFCITIDFDSKTDSAVTVRERDSMKQIRLPVDVLTSSTPTQLLKMFNASK